MPHRKGLKKMEGRSNEHTSESTPPACTQSWLCHAVKMVKPT